MCLSKHFKKEDYEKINERGKCLYKSCILKGEDIDSKLCSEGWKNWSAGWSNGAKISIFNLCKFIWVSSGARPSTLVSFWIALGQVYPCPTHVPWFFQSSWDPISLYVGKKVKKIVCVKNFLRRKLYYFTWKIASLDISYCHPIHPIKFENENCITRWSVLSCYPQYKNEKYCQVMHSTKIKKMKRRIIDKWKDFLNPILFFMAG